MSLFDNIVGTGLAKNENGNALICDGESYTYFELIEKVEIIAKKFRENGIEQGHKVLIIGKNPLHFSFILLTLMYIEAIPMPVNFDIGNNKIEGIINYYDVNYIVCVNKNNIRSEYIYQEWNENDGVTYKIYNCMNDKDVSLIYTKIILFSSGTTNTPKAIMLSEDNVFSNVAAISQYLKINTTDNILLVKDLSHSSSIIGELFVGLYNGSAVVLTTHLPLSGTILQLLDSKKISVFFAVPTLLKTILINDKLKKFDLSALRIINFYGASMNYRDIEYLMEIFPNTNVIYSYGQTEASPRVTYIERQDLLLRKGSSGIPIENVKVNILGDKDCLAQPYEMGEILVVGPNVMLGYYRNEQMTKKVKRNNVLYTGDIGYLDKDGFLYVTGRKDNMVISAGKNIYPEEIESVLMSYEGIAEALVVAKESNDGICELTGYVVMKNNSVLEHDGLFAHCKNNLDLYKIPKTVVVVQSLEKTASGKIVRKQSFLNV